METKKMTVTKAIELLIKGEVDSSLPNLKITEGENSLNVYTQNDVIELLKRLEVVALTDTDIDDLADEVERCIGRFGTEVVDLGTAEFGIERGNELCIESIDVDTYEITSQICGAIRDWYSEYQDNNEHKDNN
jgi:hypothetical protein